MNLFRSPIYVSRIIADINVLLFTFLLANYICIPHWQLNITTNCALLLIFTIFSWLLSAKYINLYDEFRSRYFGHEVVATLKTTLVTALSIIVFLFLTKAINLSRGFFIIFISSFFLLLLLEKYFIRQVLNNLRRKGRNQRNMLIIGAGMLGMEFYGAVRDNPHFGYNVIGFLDDEKKPYLNGEYLGKIADLDSVLATARVEDVVVALPNNATAKLSQVVRSCENNATRVKILPNYYSYIPGSYNVSMFDKFPVISVRDTKINNLSYRLLKRAFDISFTFLLFTLVFSWLWPIIALGIKLNSKGPVFYKQERWGRNNKKFYAYKFRSMKFNGNDDTFKQATKNDSRVTSIGSILRKTNLDELPQFINVLKGEMSIVGPRPHPTDLNLESKEKVDLYMVRHLVKGGITGWAQVNGYRGETRKTILMKKRVEHDIWYIENWSFWLDVNIIMLTVWNMLKGDPAAY